MKHHLLAGTLAMIALALPATASASGIGKFVQGGESKVRDCEAPTDTTDGGIYKLRTAALFGWTGLPSQDSTTNTLYLDAGYRFWNATTGCRARSGFFASKNWSWHSLSVVASSEVNVTDIDATTFAPQLAWELRRENKGGLFGGNNAFAVGLGATAGPYFGRNDTGVTGSVILRSVLDFRFAGIWSFEDGLGWSAQIGLVDPHITIWRLFFEDD